jgi:hypothetical protein
MKHPRCKVTLGLLVLIAGVTILAAEKRSEVVDGKNEAPAALDAERIGKAAGARASTTADGVVRVGWARTDAKVTVEGIPLKPFTGLVVGSVRGDTAWGHPDGRYGGVRGRNHPRHGRGL